MGRMGEACAGPGRHLPRRGHGLAQRPREAQLEVAQEPARELGGELLAQLLAQRASSKRELPLVRPCAPAPMLV